MLNPKEIQLLEDLKIQLPQMTGRQIADTKVLLQQILASPSDQVARQGLLGLVARIRGELAGKATASRELFSKPKVEPVSIAGPKSTP